MNNLQIKMKRLGHLQMREVSCLNLLMKRKKSLLCLGDSSIHAKTGDINMLSRLMKSRKKKKVLLILIVSKMVQLTN